MLALVLAAAAVGHASWSAGQEGWTYDEEAFHLGWAERFLDTGISERTSQERFNSKTPIMLPGVLARKAARSTGVTDAEALRFARPPSVVWLGLLLTGVRRGRVGPTAGAGRGRAALDPTWSRTRAWPRRTPLACATLATILAASSMEKPSPLRSAASSGARVASRAKVSAVLSCPDWRSALLQARPPGGTGGEC